MTIERLFQHSWRGNFNPQFTSTKTSTQSVYFFDAGEKTNTADENPIRKKKEKE